MAASPLGPDADFTKALDAIQAGYGQGAALSTLEDHFAALSMPLPSTAPRTPATKAKSKSKLAREKKAKERRAKVKARAEKRRQQKKERKEVAQKKKEEAAAAADAASQQTVEEAYFSKEPAMEVSYDDAWEEGCDGGCFNYETWFKNPQYLLRVEGPAKVKVTLKQHKTLEHIGYYVLEGNADGRRLFSNSTMIDKCKFEDLDYVEATLALPASSKPYVIVPATYEPNFHANFTITATVVGDGAPITFQKLTPARDWAQVSISGKWEGDTAGGCRNYPTHIDNDQYLLRAEEDCEVRVVLESKKALDDVGIYLLAPEAGFANHKLMSLRGATVENKSGFKSQTIATVEHQLKAGQGLVAICCTFEPGKECDYTLHVYAGARVEVRPLFIPRTVTAKGSWTAETAGGCLNHASWRMNQQYSVTVKAAAQVQLRQTVEEGEKPAAIGFYVLSSGGSQVYDVSKENFVSKASFMPSPVVSCALSPRDGKEEETFTVIPCTFEPNQLRDFELVAFSQSSSDPAPIVTTVETLNEVILDSEWTGLAAGGCLNHATWKNNPQFRLIVDADSDVVLMLQQDRPDEHAHSIGFYVTEKPGENERSWQLTPDNIVKKASFRRSQTVHCVLRAEAGKQYNIIACAFSPLDNAKFRFMAATPKNKICLFPIPDSEIDLSYRTSLGAWTEATAGGSMNNMSWPTNPHFLLSVQGKQPVTTEVVLSQDSGAAATVDLKAIGFSITPGDENGFPCISSPADIITKANYENSRDVAVTVTLQPRENPYVITPSTFEPGLTGDFTLQVFTGLQEMLYLRPLGVPEIEFATVAEEEADMMTDMMELLAEEAVVALDDTIDDRTAAQEAARNEMSLAQQLEADTYAQLLASFSHGQRVYVASQDAVHVRDEAPGLPNVFEEEEEEEEEEDEEEEEEEEEEEDEEEDEEDEFLQVDCEEEDFLAAEPPQQGGAGADEAAAETVTTTESDKAPAPSSVLEDVTEGAPNLTAEVPAGANVEASKGEAVDVGVENLRSEIAALKQLVSLQQQQLKAKGSLEEKVRSLKKQVSHLASKTKEPKKTKTEKAEKTPAPPPPAPAPAPPPPPVVVPAPLAPPPPKGANSLVTKTLSPFRRSTGAAPTRDRSATRDRLAAGSSVLDSIRMGVKLKDSSLRKVAEAPVQLSGWTPFNVDKIVARRQALEFSDGEDDDDDDWD